VNEDWRDNAACADPSVDADLFFPERGTPSYEGNVAAALLLCSSCPVRVECLEDALKDPELEGVWGGYTVEERDQINRRNSHPRRVVRVA
jgi:WhiB family transcriptional regulator, redox-sensing transcriptional regulator